MICFGLLSMRLSRSHDSSHEFYRFICVDLSCFIVSYF